MKKIFLIIILFINFIPFNKIISKEYTIKGEIVLKKEIPYSKIPNNYDTLEIYILQEKIKSIKDNNLYVLLFNKCDDYLFDISGLGNIEEYDSTYKFDFRQIKLNNSQNNEYYFFSNIHGSTYGAYYVFIIWYDKECYSWNIKKMDFTNFKFKDINKDGIYEIIDNTSRKKPLIYRFINGELIKINK